MKLKYHNLTAELSSTPSWLLHSCKHHRTAKQIHASLIVSTGLLPASISSKLMSLYARFNDLESVIWVFNSLHEQPNTMMWNLIIRSHVDLGHLESAISLYRKMRELGVAHDSFTFPIINQAISSIQREVIYGEMIHCLAIHMGFDQDLYFCNTMIEVYVKCGCVICARKLFDVMLQRDLVSWTSMISGYVSAGHVAGACHLFNKMTMGLKPNSVTMIVMLQACCASGTLIGGTQVRGYAVKSGLSMDGSVQNSVLKMYTELGSTEEVERFFSEIQKVDVVSWNTIISFYSTNGDIEKVVDMFIDMHSGEVLSWNIETLTVVISAFAKHGNVSEGESLHCLVIKTGLCDHVLLTSLLNFYAKCGKLEVSIQLFKEIHYRSSVTWGAVMSGLVQNGYFGDAINLFQQMQVAHLDPEPDTLRNLVDAYANLGALKLGKAIHGHLIRSTVYSAGEDIAYLETSVLNMYIRCGNISSAIICFDAMSVKDVVAWTTMIEGFGSHGFGYEALKYFNLMMEQRVEPNAVTFLSLLSACSHSGLVSEGSKIFHSMKWIFGIEPGLDHYTCMVDLLGRYEQLKEALALILKMIIPPDSRIWGALLAACRVYGNRKLGEYTAQRLLELEPDNVGYYTLWSNVKASVGKWNEVEEVRKVMIEKDLKKKPGWSCIEAKGVIQGFVSGDRSDCELEEMYELLGGLSRVIQNLDVM